MFLKILIRSVQFTSILSAVLINFIIVNHLIEEVINKQYYNYLTKLGSPLLLIGLFWIICAISYIKLGNRHCRNFLKYKNDYFFYKFQWFKINSISIRRFLGILSFINLVLFVGYSLAGIYYCLLLILKLQSFDDFKFFCILGLILLLGLFPFIINSILKYSYKLITWVKG